MYTLLNLLDSLLGKSEHICESVTVRGYLLECVNHARFKWNVMHHDLLHQVQHAVQQIVDK